MSQFETLSKELVGYLQQRTTTDKENIATINETLDNLGSNVATQTLNSTSINNTGPLSTTGNLSVNTNKFIVDSSTGNTTIAGSLITGPINTSTISASDITLPGISSLTDTIGTINSDILDNAQNIVTLQSDISDMQTIVNSANDIVTALATNVTTTTVTTGTLNASGNIAVNTNKFTVNASTGNTAIAGTLTVAGTSNFESINSNDITATSLTSNGSVSGTYGIFSGTISSSGISNTGNLSVSGVSTLGTVNTNALTATSGTFSRPVSAVGLSSSNGLTVSSGSTTLGTTTVTNLDNTGNETIDGNLTVNGTLTLPSYTTSQMNAIASPVDGMLIYNSTSDTLYAYQNHFWVSISGTINATDATFSGTLITNNLTTTDQTISNSLTVAGTSNLGSINVNTNKFTVNSTSGNTAVAGTLNATGATTLGDTLVVTGNTTLTGATSIGNTLGVTGNTTLGGALNVIGTTNVGTLVVGNNESITGNLSVGGTLTVSGATYESVEYITTSLDVSGNNDVGIPVTIEASGSVNPIMKITDSNSNKYLTVGNNCTLSVDGSTTLNSGLTVSSGSTSLQALTATSATISGATSLTNTTNSGNLNVTGTITFPSYTTTQMNAIASPVNGMIIYNSTTSSFYAYQANTWSAITGAVSGTTATFSGTVSTGGITSSNGLTVSSGTTSLQAVSATNETLSGTLSVTGTATLGTTNVTSLSASGNTSITGTLSAGATTISSLTDNGNASITGTLSAGATTLSSLTTTGNESIGGTLTVTGATTLNSVLTLPSYTTTQVNNISGGPHAGMLLFNTTDGAIEGYTGTSWKTMSEFSTNTVGYTTLAGFTNSPQSFDATNIGSPYNPYNVQISANGFAVSAIVFPTVASTTFYLWTLSSNTWSLATSYTTNSGLPVWDIAIAGNMVLLLVANNNGSTSQYGVHYYTYSSGALTYQTDLILTSATITLTSYPRSLSLKMIDSTSALACWMDHNANVRLHEFYSGTTWRNISTNAISSGWSNSHMQNIVIVTPDPQYLIGLQQLGDSNVTQYLYKISGNSGSKTVSSAADQTIPLTNGSPSGTYYRDCSINYDGSDATYKYYHIMVSWYNVSAVTGAIISYLYRYGQWIEANRYTNAIQNWGGYFPSTGGLVTSGSHGGGTLTGGNNSLIYNTYASGSGLQFRTILLTKTPLSPYITYNELSGVPLTQGVGIVDGDFFPVSYDGQGGDEWVALFDSPSSGSRYLRFYKRQTATSNVIYKQANDGNIEATTIRVDDGGILKIPVTSNANATGVSNVETGNMWLSSDDNNIYVKTANSYKNVALIDRSTAGSSDMGNITVNNLTANGTTTLATTNVSSIINSGDETVNNINFQSLAYNSNSASIGSVIDASTANNSIIIAKGTTGQRPTGIKGMLRYNTSNDQFEGYTGSWGQIGGSSFNPTLTSVTLGDMLFYNGSSWVNGYYIVAPTLANPSGTTLSIGSSFTSPFNMSESARQYQIYSDIGLLSLVVDSGTLSSGATFNATSYVTNGNTYYLRSRIKGTYGSNWSNWSATLPWTVTGTVAAPTFGFNNYVTALYLNGNTLYAGGNFTTANGATVNYIASWNGTVWSSLNSGTDALVSGICLDLYTSDIVAVGQFGHINGTSTSTYYIGKWDGTIWHTAGGGIVPGTGVELPLNGVLNAITKDSNGNVYIAGNDTTDNAGNNQTNQQILKWNGSLWSTVGTGTNDIIMALVYDNSNNLYAGGYFTTAGGTSALRIAKWNGSSWSALGSGMNAYVLALCCDTSNNIYAGGNFTTAGGTTVNYVAKWNGTIWSAMGSGTNGIVRAIVTDSSNNVYIGGDFTTAGGSSANYVAKWNGSSWSALQTGMNNSVYALCRNGNDYIFVGGNFTTANGSSSNYISTWNPSGSWIYAPVYTGPTHGLNSTTNGIAIDSSNNLYVVGSFTAAGSTSVNYIAKWNGLTWSVLGTGLNSTGNSVCVDSNNYVYVSGTFTTAGGVSASGIAKWNGSAWSSIGTMTGGYVYANPVNNYIYIGNGVSNLNSVGVYNNSTVPYYTGSSWSATSSCASFLSGDDGQAQGMCFDSSGNVYVVMNRIHSGSYASTLVLKWNGSVWSVLSSNAPQIQALCMDHNNNLYIGGYQMTSIYDDSIAGNVFANGVAKYNGTSWSALGSGITSNTTLYITSMCSDTHNNIYVNGLFNIAGGVSVNNIAKWNGSSWSALGTGVNERDWGMVSDSHDNIYMIGNVTTAGGSTTAGIATWNAGSSSWIAAPYP